MAVNRKFSGESGTTQTLRLVAQTASRTNNYALSGDPVRVGQRPGVAVKDADSNGKAPMYTRGVFSMLVAGIDSSGSSGADANVAVKGGDAIYFDESKTPPLSKRSGGVFWGYAEGDHNSTLVASGATTTTCDVAVGRT